MSANAVWNTGPKVPTSTLLPDKQSGLLPLSSMSNNKGTASVFTKVVGGKKQISKAAAMALFGRAGGAPNGNQVMPVNVGPGTRGMGKHSSSSMSTSALSHMMLRDNSSNFVPSKSSVITDGGDEAMDNGSKNLMFANNGTAPPPTKLRKETLMSLGISTRSRAPKSCLKQSGSSNRITRASTMASIREIEVILPGSRPLKRNTSITFKDTVQVKRVPSTSSLAQNPKDLWVQRDEERHIRQTAKALVQVIDDSGVDPDLIDIRGLEGHTKYERRRCQARKNDAWDAVLDAQDFQRYTGDYDDEQIAALVRTLSRECLAEAQSRAQRDAAVARRGTDTPMELPSGESFLVPFAPSL